MILVTGASGNVGRNVVEQLVDAGEKVRAMSRNPERAGLPDGVEVVRGDLSRPETLLAALQGVDRAFLFPVPGHMRGFLDGAQGSGVGRVVLLSSAAVRYGPANAIGRMHADCEAAVVESGLPWTFLRPGAFMTNDLNWAPGIRAAGVVRGLGGDAATSPIDERDIAAVAVRALLDGGHARKAYLLTGPEALPPVERVRIVGDVLGRELRFEEQTPEEARQAMLTHFPPEIVDSMLAMFADAAGTVAEVSPTVREVTGHAHRYADWAAHHAADFR
jgi:uncharacterized protein YbjT (DUF2867 family)